MSAIPSTPVHIKEPIEPICFSLPPTTATDYSTPPLYTPQCCHTPTTHNKDTSCPSSFSHPTSSSPSSASPPSHPTFFPLLASLGSQTNLFITSLKPTDIFLPYKLIIPFHMLCRFTFISCLLLLYILAYSLFIATVLPHIILLTFVFSPPHPLFCLFSSSSCSNSIVYHILSLLLLLLSAPLLLLQLFFLFCLPRTALSFMPFPSSLLILPPGFLSPSPPSSPSSSSSLSFLPPHITIPCSHIALTFSSLPITLLASIPPPSSQNHSSPPTLCSSSLFSLYCQSTRLTCSSLLAAVCSSPYIPFSIIRLLAYVFSSPISSFVSSTDSSPPPPHPSSTVQQHHYSIPPSSLQSPPPSASHINTSSSGHRRPNSSSLSRYLTSLFSSFLSIFSPSHHYSNFTSAVKNSSWPTPQLLLSKLTNKTTTTTHNHHTSSSSCCPSSYSRRIAFARCIVVTAWHDIRFVLLHPTSLFQLFDIDIRSLQNLSAYIFSIFRPSSFPPTSFTPTSSPPSISPPLLVMPTPPANIPLLPQNTTNQSTTTTTKKHSDDPSLKLPPFSSSASPCSVASSLLPSSFLLLLWSILDTCSLLLVSSLRFFAGAVAARRLSHCLRPCKPLRLFEFEGCPLCKSVREVLCVLEIDHFVYPCPRESLRSSSHLSRSRYRSEVENQGGKVQVPFLADPNTGIKMYESAEIVDYLWRHYGDLADAPLNIRLANSSRLYKRLSLAAQLLLRPHMDMGILRTPSRQATEPIHIWGCEPSPGTKRVRELLSSLELHHYMHVVPMFSERRRTFIDQHSKELSLLRRSIGYVGFPYMHDRNTGTKIFGSHQIVDYIRQTYQIGKAPDESWLEYHQ
eukprot:GHVS01050151.1.p1 GENE.GHVS01050151.1~~GHVS01050151.1.p1  ORF type:complete len:850 (-),score=186.87 GHVS01050151.1:775-3324(-)